MTWASPDKAKTCVENGLDLPEGYVGNNIPLWEVRDVPDLPERL